jgi:hypothetical protein
MRNFLAQRMRRARAGLIALSTAAVVLGAGACSSILDADLPGRIPTDLLADPKVASTLAASVVADFECAFGNYVNASSMISDQFLGASGNLTAKNWGTKRIPDTDTSNEQDTCAGYFGSYTPLQTARYQSEDIQTRLGGWTDEQAGTPLAPLKARVATYGAYAYALLGEGFCAMRFDQATQILQPADVLAIAETKFDNALTLAQAANSTDMINLAHAGRARVRLDRGNLSGAADDAAQVPVGFEFFVTRGADAATRYNDAWYIMKELGNSSVDVPYRNLTVGSKPDPRVPVALGSAVGLPDLSFDGVTPLYVITSKNTSRQDHMRLASYIEAQLIRAEALGGATAVQIINARRDELGLDHYTGPTDAASITALVLDERNREFFMEGGHRFNDLLRYNIPWKTGLDQIGTPYGSTTCFPLPASERLGATGA